MHLTIYQGHNDSAQAEFEIICEEAQLVSKFSALKELADQQGLITISDTG